MSRLLHWGVCVNLANVCSGTECEDTACSQFNDCDYASFLLAF